jgi:hypothetical protein
MNIETRCYNSNIQTRAEGEDNIAEGYAAVFGAEYDMGWYTEVVEKGAFEDALKKSDIRALFNHNSDMILGRQSAKTLEVSEDDKGLFTRIKIPETQAGKDFKISASRGDVNQMSMAFTIAEEEWTKEKGEKDKRTIRKMEMMYDVSPVTFPASPSTEIALRSHDKAFEETPKVNYDIEKNKLNLLEVER